MLTSEWTVAEEVTGGMASRHELVRVAVAEGRALTEPEAYRVLADYGIPVPRFGVACDAGAAAKVASSIGYPVVMKIVSPDILHKTDVGGVRMGLSSEDEVRRACEGIISSVRERCPNARVEGVLVTQQVGGRPGDGPPDTVLDAVEVIVGVTRDPEFGHAIMFGLGGVFVEVLRDVAFRVTPVTYDDALEMIDEIKGRPILRGIRGQSPRDVDALADIIVKVSRLVEENPEVSAIDLNPVLALMRGAYVVDAKLTI